MTDLQKAAMAFAAMSREDVEHLYGVCWDWPPSVQRLVLRLCESHERLRMDLEGAEAEAQAERRKKLFAYHKRLAAERQKRKRK